MTEAAIINDLYSYYGHTRGGKKSKLMLDCAYVWNWESDFVSLNSSGYYIECEVKCSKADFKADFSKEKRHKCLSSKLPCRRPNKFLFVTPVGMIDVKEIPSYAGLLYYLPEDNWFVEVKPAPFLHKTKMNLFEAIAVKLMYKYLNLRKK